MPSTRPSRRPLAKILSLLHSVPGQTAPQENTYTSIAEDSVYQSLPPQPAAERGDKTGHSDGTPALFKIVLQTITQFSQSQNNV